MLHWRPSGSGVLRGCHGADGRGDGKAPSLVSLLSCPERSDAELSRIVHDGTTGGMPPFAQIGDANIEAVVHYVRLLQGQSASTKDASEARALGNADAGRQLYFGKAQCSACHLMQGKGGFIAGSLTFYGRNRSPDAIRSAITNPDDPLLRSSQPGTPLTTRQLKTASFSESRRLPEIQSRAMKTKLGLRGFGSVTAGVVFLVVCLGIAHPQTENATPRSTDKNLGAIDAKPDDLLHDELNGNWSSYNGDYAGRRFSSLHQITTSNVHQLLAQWVFHPRTVSPLEVTPIVVAGIMFITSANDAYALVLLCYKI